MNDTNDRICACQAQKQFCQKQFQKQLRMAAFGSPSEFALVHPLTETLAGGCPGEGRAFGACWMLWRRSLSA